MKTGIYRITTLFQDLCNDGLSKEDVPYHSSFLVDDLSGDAVVSDAMEIGKLEGLRQEKFDCKKCLKINNAQCGNASINTGEDLNTQRLDFDNMVAKMSALSEQVCSCRQGYLPVYDAKGELEKCHDPIILTSTIGGQCLHQGHCKMLDNSLCRPDPKLKFKNGLPLKTCQCLKGFWPSKYSCDPENDLAFAQSESVFKPTSTTSSSIVVTCSGEDDNCTSIENAFCDIGKGQCACIEGFLPVYDEDHPRKLTWCKDPIILTSTVGGYCLVPRHCKSLMGTVCSDKNPGEGGQFKRCQCREGLKPQRPDPVLGVVRRCIGPNEQGVLSLISQALFGPQSTLTGYPLQVNLKLTEKAILESCNRIVSSFLGWNF